MPHIRIRALSEEQVQGLSSQLCTELAQIIQTPEDNFTVELISSQFYSQNKPVQADPMVEVLWFDRGQDVQNRAAKRITEMLQEISASHFISVVFIPLLTRNYYENGQHF